MLTVCPIYLFNIRFNKNVINLWQPTHTKKTKQQQKNPVTLSLKIDHFKNLELITAFGPIPISTGINCIQANTLFGLSAFVKGDKQLEEEILIWISEDLKNWPVPMRLSEHSSQWVSRLQVKYPQQVQGI